MAPGPPLKKSFSLGSMLALSVSLMATWEASCSVFSAGLVSGGPVSLVYGSIVCLIGSMCSALSLAELASKYPRAGGQYDFVCELSPASIRRVCSWIAGYISVLGWVAVAGSAPFLAGGQIQGLIILNDPSYIPERWHQTLIFWAILLASTMVCTLCSSVLPLIQRLIMAFHVVLFFAFIIVMCVVSDNKNTASFVFTVFENGSGWTNDGIAWCIGLLSPAYVLVGYDSAMHMSEEIENPARNVPWAMCGAVLLNGLMGFCFLVVMLFSMGELESVLSSPTGFPFIQAFLNATRSQAGAAVMAALITLMAVLATLGLITSASRMLWSFARDQALPFSGTLSRVDSTRGIPVIATWVVTGLLILLGLINIGSTTAFNAILSLAVVGLHISYLMPIALLLYRRATPDLVLRWGPFQLGRFGPVTNLIAAAYLTFTSILLLFPPYRPVTSLNMNYAVVVLPGAILLGVLYWVVRARKRYIGPLIEVEGQQSQQNQCEDAPIGKV